MSFCVCSCVQIPGHVHIWSWPQQIEDSICPCCISYHTMQQILSERLYRVRLCVLANWRQRLSACCDLSSLEAWCGTIQQCTHNTIIPYVSQYNNTIRGTIQQYTDTTQHVQQAAQYNNILTIRCTYNKRHNTTIYSHCDTIRKTIETSCIQCGSTPGCRIILNHTRVLRH